MAKASHEQLLEEFRGKILPQNHPLTQAVRDVVTRILEASNLGSLRVEPAFTQAGTSIEDLWHADVQNSEVPVPGSGGREWRLVVVNDPKVVNAMASFGQWLDAYTSWSLLTDGIRQYCGFYRYHSCSRRRGWSCCYPWTWSVFQVLCDSIQH